MDPITIIGMAITAGGFIDSLFGDSKAKALAQQQNKIASQISANSKEQNNLRKEAATNDYMTAMRQSIRASQVARATALSNATSQGASYGSSLQGGYGQILGKAGEIQAGLSGDYTAGQQIFDLDNTNADLQTKYNKLGGKIQLAQSQGDNLMKLGQTLMGNAPQINNSMSGIKNVFSGT